MTDYLHIFHDQSKSKDKTVDEITTVRMLEVFDNADVLDTVLNLPDKQEVGNLLKQLLQLLPPVTLASGKFTSKKSLKMRGWLKVHLHYRKTGSRSVKKQYGLCLDQCVFLGFADIGA